MRPEFAGLCAAGLLLQKVDDPVSVPELPAASQCVGVLLQFPAIAAPDPWLAVSLTPPNHGRTGPPLARCWPATGKIAIPSVGPESGPALQLNRRAVHFGYRCAALASFLRAFNDDRHSPPMRLPLPSFRLIARIPALLCARVRSRRGSPRSSDPARSPRTLRHLQFVLEGR
jgi:hypothetical protein